jgi:hypothetical protein
MLTYRSKISQQPVSRSLSQLYQPFKQCTEQERSPTSAIASIPDQTRQIQTNRNKSMMCRRVKVSWTCKKRGCERIVLHAYGGDFILYKCRNWREKETRKHWHRGSDRDPRPERCGTKRVPYDLEPEKERSWNEELACREHGGSDWADKRANPETIYAPRVVGQKALLCDGSEESLPWHHDESGWMVYVARMKELQLR